MKYRVVRVNMYINREEETEAETEAEKERERVGET